MDAYLKTCFNEFQRKMEAIVPKEPPLPFLKIVKVHESHFRRNLVISGAVLFLFGAISLSGCYISQLSFGPLVGVIKKENRYYSYSALTEAMDEIVERENARILFFCFEPKNFLIDGAVSKSSAYYLEGTDTCQSHGSSSGYDVEHTLSTIDIVTYHNLFSVSFLGESEEYRLDFTLQLDYGSAMREDFEELRNNVDGFGYETDLGAYGSSYCMYSLGRYCDLAFSYRLDCSIPEISIEDDLKAANSVVEETISFLEDGLEESFMTWYENYME